jgi:hypothetical protein
VSVCACCGVVCGCWVAVCGRRVGLGQRCGACSWVRVHIRSWAGCSWVAGLWLVGVVVHVLCCRVVTVSEIGDEGGCGTHLH